MDPGRSALGPSTLHTLAITPTLYAGVDAVLGHADLGQEMQLRLDEQLAQVRPEQLGPEHMDELEPAGPPREDGEP